MTEKDKSLINSFANRVGYNVETQGSYYKLVIPHTDIFEVFTCMENVVDAFARLKIKEYELRLIEERNSHDKK